MRPKAIGLCRVSSKEQLEGHSLDSQEENILKLAKELDLQIVHLLRIQTSSNKGKNIRRKDLQEAYEICRQDKNIKYFLVDKVNRFMREMEVFFYWKVKFKEELGVTVFFCDPEQKELNDNRSFTKIRLAFKAYDAETDNEDRSQTAIARMKSRVAAGYYPFYPHQGYKKTAASDGLHIPHEPYFGLLKKALESIANFEMKPPEALHWLHENGYKTPKAGQELDMERFENIAKDIYYAGKLRIKDWPEAEGLHEAMITLEQHEILLAIFNKRTKRIKKQYNPEFPLNRHIIHEECKNIKNGKFTGFLHANGKGWTRYEYSCRECNRSIPRDLVHEGLNLVLENMKFRDAQIRRFKLALTKAWKNEEKYRLEKLARLNKELGGLNISKGKYVTAIVNNPSLADDIKPELDKVKLRISELEARIHDASDVNKEFQKFTEFALSYVENLRENFWDLDAVRLPECLELLFPEQITVDSGAKVHIPKISPIYSLAVTKNAPEMASDANMVELAGTTPASDW